VKEGGEKCHTDVVVEVRRKQRRKQRKRKQKRNNDF